MTRTFPRWDATALDMYSGASGTGQGLRAAGVEVKYAANHWEYAVRLSERNMPGTEHFLADLLDEESRLYKAAHLLPGAGILVASPSCTSHSPANTRKAYLRRQSLLWQEDPEFDARATEGERNRSTMLCVLQWVQQHLPLCAVVENVVEVCFWGLDGDGSMFRWWKGELAKLGYNVELVFINSAFFGAPQYRDRLYVVATRVDLPRPSLDFRPLGHCPVHGRVELIQTWKPRKRTWPLERWGKWNRQYFYRCSRCSDRRPAPIKPYARGAWEIIDWSDLGIRIGDRERCGLRPLKSTTLARIRRGLERFNEFPAVVVPVTRSQDKSDRSSSLLDALPTQTAQQERALVLGAPMLVAKASTDERPPRAVDDQLPTLTGYPDTALAVAQVITAAGNTFERKGSTCRSRSVDQPLPTTTGTLAEGFYSAVFTNRGGEGQGHLPESRFGTVADPLRAVVGAHFNGGLISLAGRALMFVPGLLKHHGAAGATAPHSPIEPMGTVTSVCSNSLVTAWQAPYRNVTGPADGVGDPLPALCTQQQMGFAAVRAFQASYSHGRQEDCTLAGMHEPCPTVVGSNQNALAAWQESYVTEAPARSVAEPIATQATHSTNALCLADEIDIEEVYFRMFKPEELKLAMTFPATFELFGPVRDQVKAIGAAVTSCVAEMLMRRLLPILGGGR